MKLGRWLLSAGLIFVIAASSHLVLLRAGIEIDETLATWLLATPALPIILLAMFFARRGQTLGSLSFAAFVGAILALAPAYRYLPEEGLASPVFRSLLVFPMLALVLAASGAALVQIFWDGGRFETRFGFERFIGLRYLQSLRGTVLSVVTAIALGGVILGVSLLILALAILSGFEGDLVDKIIDANAHIAVSKHAGYAFEVADAEHTEALAKKNGALSTSRFVDAEVLIASDTNHTEGHLYGIDPATAPDVYGIFSKFVAGGLDKLPAQTHGAARLPPPTEAPANHRIAVKAPKSGEEEDAEESHSLFPLKHLQGEGPSPLPGVVVGAEMAKQLHIDLGDALTLVSPLIEELTPQGPAAKAKVFRVAGIVQTKMYETDAHYVAISFTDAQHFLELGDTMSGVAIKLPDAAAAEPLSKRIVAGLSGYPFQAMSWQMRNHDLFMSLKLEKAVAFIILIFIVLVASFSIVNTLTMAVIEKAKEIAILKTIGASDVSVGKIFVVQGVVVGVTGTLVGVAFGALLAFLLSRFGIYIDPQVYNVDRLPIRLHGADVVQVAALACLLTSLSTIFPALAGARLSPVDGLRYE